MDVLEFTKQAIPLFAKHIAEAFPDAFVDGVVLEVRHVDDVPNMKLLCCRFRGGSVSHIEVVFNLSEPALNIGPDAMKSYLSMMFSEAVDDALTGA